MAESAVVTKGGIALDNVGDNGIRWRVGEHTVGAAKIVRTAPVRRAGNGPS